MKAVLKALAHTMALVAIAPLLAWYCLCGPVAGARRTFQGPSQLLSLLPGLTGAYLRRAFYSCVLARCGAGTHIEFGTILSHPTARIGTSVYIGPFCCLGDVTLEDDVVVASHVSIMNGSRQHGTERLDIPIRKQPGEYPRVTIGEDSWIGERAIVQAEVGKHCVIGAGAVVTKPIPDYAVAVGVPARIVRYRNQPDEAGREG